VEEARGLVPRHQGHMQHHVQERPIRLYCAMIESHLMVVELMADAPG
jgi:hypothetical protein